MEPMNTPSGISRTFDILANLRFFFEEKELYFTILKKGIHVLL